MSPHPLGFLFPRLRVAEMQVHDRLLTITAAATATEACCPHCQAPSGRVHSYYQRCPQDLPVGGYQVRLQLHVRRFRCLNSDCAAATFTERLPDLVQPAARRTARLKQTLTQLSLMLGGEAGARYGTKNGMSVSPDTLLRLARQHVPLSVSTPRVLGVDDFALRRGRVYGTILVDLEAHRPIDLLPDRRAETLAQWLRAHPGVEVISRDRSTEYARGATDGAPAAQQVADRWHLLGNVREAFERFLDRRRPSLPTVPVPADATPTVPATLSPYDRDRRRGTKDQVAQQQSRARRYERYTRVKTLQAQGHNILQIAKRTGYTRQTVRHWMRSEHFPEQAPRPRRKSILDPYVPYLQERWQAGCHNGAILLSELRERGYSGSSRPLHQWLALRRERLLGLPRPAGRRPARTVEIVPPAPPPPATTPLPSARQLVWVCLGPEERLDANQQMLRQHLLAVPDIRTAVELAQQFFAMVRHRRSEAFLPWVAACHDSGITELETFAAGLHREAASIQAALSSSVSNGQTEGQVTRLKQIRRAMYGRGKLDLLKARVLAVA